MTDKGEIDLARGHNFLFDILLEIQENETDGKIKTALEKRYKSLAVKLKIKKNREKEINPKNLPKLLHKINKDIILSTTSHSIDQDMLTGLLKELRLTHYSFDEHIRAIHDRFDKLTEKRKGGLEIPTTTYAMLAAYYLSDYSNDINPNPWSENNIRISWSDRKVKEWANKYPGRVLNPNVSMNETGLLLDQPITNAISGEYMTTFADIVDQFKRSILLTSDYLEQQLKYKLALLKGTYKDLITLSFSFNINPGIELFTDSEKAIQLIQYIVESYCDKLKVANCTKANFDISFQESGSRVAISIFEESLDSIKSLNEIKLKRYGTRTKEIRKKANGLCLVDIVSNFPKDGVFKYPIWPTLDFSVVESDDIKKGVKHILTFEREQ